MWYFMLAALILPVVAVLLVLWRSLKTNRSVAAEQTFFIKPYLQPGSAPGNGTRQSLELCWHARFENGDWKVQYRSKERPQWTAAPTPNRRSINVGALPAFFGYSTLLEGLPAGGSFEYRVCLNGREVFLSEGKTLKTAGQDHRFVVAGDLAEGGAACRQIAAAVYRQNPDVVVMPGDLVYKRGTVGEYLERFFPVYNADAVSADQGAPLLRSVPVITAVGNHDVAMQNVSDVPDLDRHADLMGYFIFLSQPLNGPLGIDSRTSVPKLAGAVERKEAMFRAAGDRYPRMANFSLDAGDVHWLVLDANAYMNWQDPHLLAWVERDLAATAKRWKFVCFHQPAFTTDVKHADEQQMRLLAPLFQKHGVQVVFSGHNHTYERSYPLRFAVTPGADGSPIEPSGRVKGTFELDKNFDGVEKTRPEGIIYIVSGAGGAKLYLSPERRADQNLLPVYTYKLVDDKHSFTVCDVTRNRVVFRQLSADGAELDSFAITAP